MRAQNSVFYPVKKSQKQTLTKTLIFRQQKNVLTYFKSTIFDYFSVPRKSCSLSIASKRALKFPFPKDCAPFLWMISKNMVGLSKTGLVKICNK